MITINKVLTTTREVVENSKNVKININNIYKFCSELKYPEFIHWLQHSPFDIFNLSIQKRLNFITIMDSISFCYWREPKWEIPYEDNYYDGTWGLIVALGKALKTGYPITDFKYISQMSKDDFDKIFKGNTDIPLDNERYLILKELGTVIVNKFGSDFNNLVLMAKNDIFTMLHLILKFIPSFNDVSIFMNKKVFFFKRAQLLISDIHQVLGVIEDKYKFHNISKLTAFADYKLPLVLNSHGIIEYSENLKKTILSKTPIKKDSNEEIEIRANTIWAVEEIKNNYRKNGFSCTSFQINDLLWIASQNKAIYKKPYHRTLTTSY